MYRALDDPRDALRQYQAHAGTLHTDSGNSKANVAAVFQREGKRTYGAYNAQPCRKTVKFSDGTTLDCEGADMAVLAK